MEIKIDNYKELNKQRAENFYKSEKYIECKVLVGRGDPMPISELHGQFVVTEDIARLLLSLKEQIKYIEKKCPEAAFLSRFMSAEKINEVSNFEKQEESNE